MKLLPYILVLFSVSLAFADDIHLRDGRIWRNFQAIDTVAGIVTFRGTNKTIRIPVGDMAAIEVAQYDPNASSTLESPAVQRAASSSKPTNLSLLPVGILAFALSWDYFSQAADIDKTLADYDKLKLDTSTLRSSRDRKTAIAVVSLLAGIVSTYLGFQSDMPNQSADSSATVQSH